LTDKILVVEDEIPLQETLVYNLEKQGYVVASASNGKIAIDKARSFQPDLILLDVMLPVMDGFEVCRVIRQEMNTPIIMLTARAEEIDRVVGLEVGADDYLSKPFSMRELLARVKALLRRVRLITETMSRVQSEDTGKNEILSGNLRIDQNRHEVFLEDHILDLAPKEYDLLLYFIDHKRYILTRNQILEKVWGWEYSGDSRTVDVHVSWLRDKIEKDPETPLRIITVRGSGYRFEG
jgi:DNA-binding response OmpR family regulator